MESIADPVSAVGEAAAILEWMRRSCPDMVPMAPLLQELLFAGFSETRCTAAATCGSAPHFPQGVERDDSKPKSRQIDCANVDAFVLILLETCHGAS